MTWEKAFKLSLYPVAIGITAVVSLVLTGLSIVHLSWFAIVTVPVILVGGATSLIMLVHQFDDFLIKNEYINDYD